jgi:hypothetical protein
MTTSELKQLCKEFEKTLDKKEKDEWYDTEQGVWKSFSKHFIQWYNNNQKKNKK